MFITFRSMDSVSVNTTLMVSTVNAVRTSTTTCHGNQQWGDTHTPARVRTHSHSYLFNSLLFVSFANQKSEIIK